MDPLGIRGDLLQAFLADRDELCPNCGYNLRGLAGSVCPECRQELRLSVGLVEPKLGAFIFGVAGIAMSLGFCVLLAALFGYSWFLRSKPDAELIPPLAIGSIVSCVEMRCWFAARRRWLGRLGSAARWAWAVGLSLLGLVCPLWFSLLAR